jgi:hypothetical protein
VNDLGRRLIEEQSALGIQEQEAPFMPVETQQCLKR